MIYRSNAFTWLFNAFPPASLASMQVVYVKNVVRDTCCWCVHRFVHRFAFILIVFSVAQLTGTSRSLSTKSLMVLPLPPSKTNTSYKAWGVAVWWLRMSRWVGAAKSSDASQSSTCRVLTIDWHVHGLWHCAVVFGTHVVCASARVCWLPGGLLPSQHRRRSIVFRVLF